MYNKYPSYYEIKFLTKKGGDRNWIVHVEEMNAKMARNKMQRMWSHDLSLSTMHPFHIDVRRMKDDEEFLYHYFHAVS